MEKQLPDLPFYKGVDLRIKKEYLSRVSFEGFSVSLFRRGRVWYLRYPKGRNIFKAITYKTATTGAETFGGAVDGAICFLHDAAKTQKPSV